MELLMLAGILLIAAIAQNLVARRDSGTPSVSSPHRRREDDAERCVERGA